MEPPDYLAVLARRKRLILAVVGVTMLAAVAASYLPAAKWTGTTIMRLEPSASISGGSVRADDITYLDRLINTYSRLVDTDQFREEVAHEAGLAERPAIDIRDVANTNLMQVQATTGDPRTAARAANEAATALVRHVSAQAAAQSRVADRDFQRRTDRLQNEVARASAELEDLNVGGVSGDERRQAFGLQERIRADRLSIAALRDNYEAYRSAQTGRAASLSTETLAETPLEPSNHHVLPALVIAALLGLIAGIGLAFAAERLSRRFRTDEEIEESVNTPILAAIPTVPAFGDPAVFNGGSVADEAYGRLGTALLGRLQKIVVAHPERSRTLLVASAVPGEGKSTVVANLGRSLARTGRRVVLVDADLRSPSLHRAFGLPNDAGLGDILMLAHISGASDAVEPDDLAVWTAHPGLAVLPAGSAVEHPPTLLGSPALDSLLERLGVQFDVIIIDSPAVLAVADALAIAPHVDAVLLVTASDALRQDVLEAHKQLERVGANLAGVIVNRTFGTRTIPYGNRYDVERVAR